MSVKAKSWTPCPYSEKEVRQIQALARGDATADQQRDALKFIVEVVAGTYDMSFRPESERDTCFAEGRRYCGLTLVKLLKIIPSRLVKQPKEKE